MNTLVTKYIQVDELDFPSLKLKLERDTFNGRALEVVRFEGKITNSNSFEVNRKIHGLFTGEAESVILDLSQLEYINSTGVAILFSLFFRLKENGGRLLIGGTHPFLRRVFSLMDLPSGMLVLDSVEEAKNNL